jgi:serine/threonine-protein kinase/endoribonuclease IRE1
MWAAYNIPATGHPPRPCLQGDAGVQVKRALQHLVDGVVYLHRLGIVHRDLKPLNVLVSSRMRLKISDMGLARKLEQDQSSFETVAGGSFGWRASEQILGRKCNKSVDVFTIGCLLCVWFINLSPNCIYSFGKICFRYYVLTGGSHPFGRETHKREANILEHDVDLSELQGPEAAEAQALIASMISAQPDRRISALQVLNLSFSVAVVWQHWWFGMQVYRHPFFWGPRLRLNFIRSLSDFLERYDVLLAIQAILRHTVFQLFIY